MKREESYSSCFDFMFMDGGFQKTIQAYLRDEWDVETVDEERLRGAMFLLLEDLHDKGAIRPVVHDGEGPALTVCPLCDRAGWVSLDKAAQFSAAGKP